METEDVIGDACGRCGGVVSVDEFGLYCESCEAHRARNNPLLKKWMECVSESAYKKATELQRAVPELRSMGTYGKMVADKAIQFIEQQNKIEKP